MCRCIKGHSPHKLELYGTPQIFMTSFQPNHRNLWIQEVIGLSKSLALADLHPGTSQRKRFRSWRHSSWFNPPDFGRSGQKYCSSFGTSVQVLCRKRLSSPALVLKSTWTPNISNCQDWMNNLWFTLLGLHAFGRLIFFSLLFFRAIDILANLKSDAKPSRIKIAVKSNTLSSGLEVAMIRPEFLHSNDISRQLL